MEVEVRRVGKQDCFVSLPSQLLEAFLSDQVPSFPLVLELRVPGKKVQTKPWFVTWDGSASRSHSHLEVAEKFADCIGLENNTRVVVRARSEVAVADSVAIEPASEDDWEMLELNAEFLEEHLLSRVGVLYEGQRFPVWIESGSVLLLQAVSTSPSKLVRLSAGTELVVAPKKRLVSTPSSDAKVSVEKGKADKAPVWTGQTFLRVQELDASLVQPVHIGSVACFSEPTTVVFVNPETAKIIKLSNGQLLALLEPSVEGSSFIARHGGREELRFSEAEGSELVAKVKVLRRSVVVTAVVTDLALQGHVMLAQALQTYLGLNCHSRVGMHPCGDPSASMPAFLEFSPAVFESVKTEDNVDADDSLRVNKSRLHVSRQVESSKTRRSNQKAFLAAALDTDPEKGIHRIEDMMNTEGTLRSVKRLLHDWVAAQAAAISCEGDEKYVPVSEATIIHLRPQQPTRSNDTERRGGAHRASNFFAKQDQNDMVFLIGFQSRDSSLRQGTPNSYILLQKRMLSDEDDRPDKETSRKTFGNRGLKAQISPGCQRYNTCGPAGAVLLCGPSACGKTSAALALARELQVDPSLLAHRVIVRCNELIGEQAGFIRKMLRDAVSEAVDHSPALIILDDLDALLPKEEGPEQATIVLVLSEFLGDLVDLYHGGRAGRLIAFLATARSPKSIPDALTLSGRFDYHVELPTPAALERATILEQTVAARGFVCKASVASDVAISLDGADGSDLEVLVDRAAHAAAGKFLSPDTTHASITEWLSKRSLSSRRERLELNALDFKVAQRDFEPGAMQGIVKGGTEVGRSGWDDVGGLHETRRALREVLELPAKYPKLIKDAPLRLRTGVLLYGPPGCGKTHIVGAAAAACSLRFISVKGPELLNKYIGASEQAVRDIFAKAASAAPVLLFFDEFDAIAPRRGHDNTGVTDRVVNQLLTELDGVEALTGVYVFAATSRPDLLDAALLRPGRLDRMLLCDFPSTSDRVEILRVLSKKLSLAEDVDLDAIASMTDGFSAADLQAVCSDAQLESVHNFLAQMESMASEDPAAKPLITMQNMQTAAQNARPSVPDSEKKKLNDVYASFQNSKKPAASKDVKGKRATLA